MIHKQFPHSAAVLFALLLAGCCTTGPTTSESMSNSAAPPVDRSEGLVQADDGNIAAELIATAAEITSDGQTTVQVVNRGAETLNFGRPFTVEKWDGETWVETEESRNSMWTMDLLYIEPGETGEEQTWPFLPDQRAEPGLYRISKRVSVDAPDPDEDPISLTIRTRVEVCE